MLQTSSFSYEQIYQSNITFLHRLIHFQLFLFINYCKSKPRSVNKIVILHIKNYFPINNGLQTLIKLARLTFTHGVVGIVLAVVDGATVFWVVLVDGSADVTGKVFGVVNFIGAAVEAVFVFDLTVVVVWVVGICKIGFVGGRMTSKKSANVWQFNITYFGK